VTVKQWVLVLQFMYVVLRLLTDKGLSGQPQSQALMLIDRIVEEKESLEA
jgi:hypothetical protein